MHLEAFEQRLLWRCNCLKTKPSLESTDLEFQIGKQPAIFLKANKTDSYYRGNLFERKHES